MYYSFRIRINRSNRNFIDSDLTEIRIPSQDAGLALFLRSASHGKSIKEAEQLVLVGEGFPSKEAAWEAGQRFEEVFMIALTKGRIGADFGYRAPKTFFTVHGLEELLPSAERPSLNNIHGLMVYPSEPKPQFVAWGPFSLNRGVTVETFHAEFGAAAQRNRRLSDQERVAIVLFNSSFFEAGADARILLLTMAIEALIKPARKSPEAIRHVDAFIKKIKESSMQKSEQDSLVSGLRNLRDESITKAGQRLAKEKLGNKRYEGQSASAFFAKVYKLRSKLVHGSTPLPTYEEIGRTAAALELFVSDLLTAD